MAELWYFQNDENHGNKRTIVVLVTGYYVTTVRMMNAIKIYSLKKKL